MLDALRIDLVASHVEDGRFPSQNGQHSIRGDGSQIARVEPAVLECLCRYIRITHVAVDAKRSANADASRFAGRQSTAGIIGGLDGERRGYISDGTTN